MQILQLLPGQPTGSGSQIRSGSACDFQRHRLLQNPGCPLFHRLVIRRCAVIPGEPAHQLRGDVLRLFRDDAQVLPKQSDLHPNQQPLQQQIVTAQSRLIHNQHQRRGYLRHLGHPLYHGINILPILKVQIVAVDADEAAVAVPIGAEGPCQRISGGVPSVALGAGEDGTRGELQSQHPCRHGHMLSAASENAGPAIGIRQRAQIVLRQLRLHTNSVQLFIG